MSVIRFQDVSKSFSWHRGHMLLREHLVALYRGAHQKRFYALKHVSFEVNKGESLAVVGDNGAGKSTLLGLVAGLAMPDTGTVQVDGHITALLEDWLSKARSREGHEAITMVDVAQIEN